VEARFPNAEVGAVPKAEVAFPKAKFVAAPPNGDPFATPPAAPNGEGCIPRAGVDVAGGANGLFADGQVVCAACS
jgi:prepilin-type processing-associated H-X9-DG protein